MPVTIHTFIDDPEQHPISAETLHQVQTHGDLPTVKQTNFHSGIYYIAYAAATSKDAESFDLGDIGTWFVADGSANSRHCIPLIACETKAQAYRIGDYLAERGMINDKYSNKRED